MSSVPVPRFSFCEMIKLSHQSQQSFYPFASQFLNPAAFPEVLQQFHINGGNSSSNGLSLPLNSSPSNHVNGGLTHNSLPWPDGSPEIDDDLAADFDGSLSGLGMEVGSSTYNMSEALMALPSLKNEPYNGSRGHRDYDHQSNSNQDSDVRPVAIVHGKKNRLALSHDEECSVSTGIKRVCISNQREVTQPHCETSRFSSHSNSAPDLRPAHSNESSPSSSSPSATQAEDDDRQVRDVSFTYVLQAATSAATKINEETMTYLNQGQSYEVKLMKTSGQHFKKVRTIIRVGFYERRLQYMEKVLIDQWRAARHSERILEVDVPLSYGISDISNDALDINKCSFVWDTRKDAGIFIKVNCISTEFTPKKHGGEKGVPFRIIIETHLLSSSISIGYDTILHAASSQVKVFKPKGADRKHKTDREKLMRRGHHEVEKFRASCDQTKFTECSIDQIYSVTNSAPVSHSRHSSIGSQDSPERRVSLQDVPDSPLDFTNVRPAIEDISLQTAVTPVSGSRFSVCPASSSSSYVASSLSPELSPQPPSGQLLGGDATAAEATQWLINSRFEKYITTFAHFSGADILRLTRSDLIQICDLTDGIRLYNSLHCHSPKPRSTIYVSTSPNEDFSAIYLEALTAQELKAKLCNILHTSVNNSVICNGKSNGNNVTPVQPIVTRIRMAGPAGIFIAVTDEVVKNIPHETMFMLDFEQEGPHSFRASLRNFNSK